MARKVAEFVINRVAERFKAIVATAGTLGQAGRLDRDLDAVTWLPVSVGDRIEGLVTQVDVAAASCAPVRVTAVTVILARIARVVHGACIGDFHDDAGTLGTAVTTAVVVASDLEALATHSFGA